MSVPGIVAACLIAGFLSLLLADLRKAVRTKDRNTEKEILTMCICLAVLLLLVGLNVLLNRRFPDNPFLIRIGF